MVGTRPTRVRADATVGRVLTYERQRRGLSVAEVSRILHIPSHHIRALETGDLSVFPAEVYARGAFTKYADFLGIRAHKTRRAFLRNLSGAREYVPLRVHTPRPWLAAMFTPRLFLALIIGGIALAVGTYITLQVQSFLHLPEVRVTEPAHPVVSEDVITLRGWAESGADVSINEEPVLLAEDGTFSKTLWLHPGISVVEVRAVNAAGRARVVTREFLLPRTE